MEKYKNLEKIAEGTYGIVYKAVNIEDQEVVAIKEFKKKYTTWDECKSLREVKSLINLKHENIVKLKEMIRTDDKLFLVFEFMQNNLYDLIKTLKQKGKHFSEGQIKYIMYHIVLGITHMHKHGFFHRDLKPENLLVKDEQIKIADFGLAREIRSLPPYTDYVSTRWYRAPECILKSNNYNSPIDIWAIGTIMAELYTLNPLFPGNNEKDLLYKLCNVLGSPTSGNWNEGVNLGKKIDFKFPSLTGCSLKVFIPEASDQAIEVLTEMLRWDPNKRPTASKLLTYQFFQKSSNLNVNLAAILNENNVKLSEKMDIKESIAQNDLNNLLESNDEINIDEIKKEMNYEDSTDKKIKNDTNDTSSQKEEIFKSEKRLIKPIKIIDSNPTSYYTPSNIDNNETKKNYFLKENKSNNKLDFLDDIIKDNTIIEPNEIKKGSKSDNNALSKIGLKNQAFGSNLPKPLYYQQKPNYKEEFSKDLGQGILNEKTYQKTNKDKLVNQTSILKEEELDEFEIVYQKYKNEKSNKLPEKRIVSNHILKQPEKKVENILSTEPINKESSNRPRSRIKSALQCIEEMFEVKKETNYTVTETNKENKPNKLLFNEVVKDSSTKETNTMNNSNVTSKHEIDMGIESMINNFPTRPGSRIRVKKEILTEKSEKTAEIKEIKKGNEELPNFESRRRKKIGNETEKSMLGGEGSQNEEGTLNNISINNHKLNNRFQKI